MNSLKSILEECRIKAQNKDIIENILPKLRFFEFDLGLKKHYLKNNQIGGRSIKFESSKRIKISRENL
jgi:hypothetical protein